MSDNHNKPEQLFFALMPSRKSRIKVKNGPDIFLPTKRIKSRTVRVVDSAPPDPDEISVREARTLIEDNLDDGLRCPCCSKWVKRYKRKINASMSRSLIWLVRAALGTGSPLLPAYSSGKSYWVDVPNTAPKWLLRTNQLPTLAWWGLVERMPKDATPEHNSTKHSGLWKPTQKGIDFAKRKITVPLAAVTYNGAVEWLEGPEVLITDCLGEKFDYKEIMGITDE